MKHTKAIDVKCLKCGAAPSVYCTTECGFAVPGFHQARVSEAARITRLHNARERAEHAS